MDTLASFTGLGDSTWQPEGAEPLQKQLPPHARNTSPYYGEGSGGEVDRQSHCLAIFSML